jgi:hypothetical protein
VNALYGNVVANLDERDWSAIMASSNPPAVAEVALIQQWQNKSYLLRNTQHLVSIGYTELAPEFTDRQMGERLAYAYSNVWSQGTRFATWMP